MKIFGIRFLIIATLLLTFVKVDAQDSLTHAEKDFKIRKGRFYGSLTFSYDARSAENEDQLFRQVVTQSKYNYRIIGNGGIAIKNNMTLGLAAGYGRAKEDITYLDENNESITSKSLQQGLSLVPNMRNYIPLGRGQLQVLVQTELSFTFGESLQRIFRQEDIDKIEGNFIEIELGIKPGFILFFDKNWAFETTVGVAGFSTRIDEKTTNNDRDNRQKIVESGIDLRLNILQLNLGVAYYF
jgi:hypothetical protein